MHGKRKKNIKLSKSFIVYDILFVQDSKNIFFYYFLKLISSLVQNDVVVAEMKGIVDTRVCESAKKGQQNNGWFIKGNRICQSHIVGIS